MPQKQVRTIRDLDKSRYAILTVQAMLVNCPACGGALVDPETERLEWSYVSLQARVKYLCECGQIVEIQPMSGVKILSEEARQ